MQKKAQLVHWTDESDFQANSWLAGYDICGFRYIIRSDIFLDSVRVQQPTEQATAKLMIFFVLTGALVYASSLATVHRTRVRKGKS